jgi:hypothetical protein
VNILFSVKIPELAKTVKELKELDANIRNSAVLTNFELSMMQWSWRRMYPAKVPSRSSPPTTPAGTAIIFLRSPALANDSNAETSTTPDYRSTAVTPKCSREGATNQVSRSRLSLPYSLYNVYACGAVPVVSSAAPRRPRS